MLHASSRALDPGPAGPDNAADGLRIPFSPMRRPKTTLVLAGSGTGYDGGCCRSRTTGNAAALRWHPPLGSRGLSASSPLPITHPRIDFRLHGDLACLQVDVCHFVVEVLVPALVDVELVV
jgi:hypothetical protein